MAVQRFILTNKWAGVLPDVDHRLDSGSWNFATQDSAKSSRASCSNSLTIQTKPLRFDDLPKSISSTNATQEDRGAEGDSTDGTAELGKYNFELLNEHNLTDEHGNKLFRCDICGGTYRHAFSLKRHYLRTHINHIYLSSSDISNCNINLSIQEEMDREDFQTKAKKNGLTKVVMTGLYRCNTCLQLFDHLPQLKHHVLNHPTSPSTNRFPCTQCKMTFSHKQNLVRHTSVHSGEKPYTCRYCHKGFPTATNQRRHERIHEGLKPYLCPHCPSHFSQSGDLKKHIRKLHLEFFHPCAFCLKYFSKESELKEHVVSHGKSLELNSRVLKRKLVSNRMREEVPTVNRLANGLAAKKLFQQGRFRCVLCAKRFNSRLHLHQHQRIAHSLPTNKPIAVPQSLPPAPPPPSLPPPPPLPVPSQLFLSSNKSSAGQKLPNGKMPVFQNGTEGHYLFAPCRYFATVSQNIAQNLQDYIDGKLTKKPKPATDSNSEPFSEKSGKEGELIIEDISWSTYNFPPDFPGIGKINLMVKQELRAVDNGCEDSCRSRTVVGDGGLNYCDDEKSVHNSETMVDNDDSDVMVLDLSVSKVLPVIESKPDKLDISTLFVCHACGERFLSLDDIEEHKVNNHPNVDCTHSELEGTKNVPVAELFLPRCSPVGVLQRCVVPPLHVTSVVAQLRCTKCQEAFRTNAELHEHILLCGGHIEYTNGRKHRAKQKMNRGMKRQLDDDPVQTRRTGPYNTRKLKKDSFDWLMDYHRPPVPYFATVESEVSLMCDHCNRKFKYSSVLERHQKSCLGNLSAVTPTNDLDSVRRQHSCVYCHRSFTYVASLKKHMDDCCPLKYTSTKKFKTVAKKPLQSLALKKRLKPKRKKKILKLVKRKIGKVLPVATPKQPDEVIETEIKPEVDSVVDVTTALENKPQEASPVKQEVVREPDPEVPEPSTPVEGKTEETVIEPEVTPEPVVKEAEVPTAPKEANGSNNPDVEATVEPQEQKEVKVEIDNTKRETIHTCPNCMRTFTYLANYKKHLNEMCPLRNSGKENAGLNVKQTQAEEEKVDQPPAVATVPEPSSGPGKLCNKMTESYVTMLKDRLSHKLNTFVVSSGQKDSRKKGGDSEASVRGTKTNKRHYDWYKGKQPRGILNRLRRLDVRSSNLAQKRNLVRGKAAAPMKKYDNESEEEEEDKSGSQDDDDYDDSDYVGTEKSRSGSAVTKPVKSMKTRSETAAKSSGKSRQKQQRGKGIISKYRSTIQRKKRKSAPATTFPDDSQSDCTKSDI